MECLSKVWQDSGCTNQSVLYDEQQIQVWQAMSLGEVKVEMFLWAEMPDETYRQSCYASDSCVAVRIPNTRQTDLVTSILPCNENLKYLCVFKSSGATSCTSCFAGAYSNSSQVLCEPCAGGMFSNTSSASECNLCGVGTYSDPGASTCTLCEAGSWGDRPGSESCEACPVGQYSSLSGASSSSQCISCSCGEFNPFNGSTSCSLCTPGTFSELGASSCMDCPAGHYSSGLGMPSCIACEPGTYWLPITVQVNAIGNTTWWESYISCQNQGGMLATVDSPEKEEQILAVISQTSPPVDSYFWIGYTGLWSGGWSWLSGSTSTYASWPQDEKWEAEQYYSCASMSGFSIAYSTNGTWKSEDCFENSEYGYICEFSSGSTSCTGCPPGTYSNISGATSEGSCIKCAAGKFFTSRSSNLCSDGCSQGTYSTPMVIQVFQETMSWDNARESCNRMGAELVTIENADQNSFVLDTINVLGLGYNMGSYWIGYSFQSSTGSTSGTWQWVSGSSADYSDWGGGAPNDPSNESCAFVTGIANYINNYTNDYYGYGYSGYNYGTGPDVDFSISWDYFDCSDDQNYGYICEFPGLLSCVACDAGTYLSISGATSSSQCTQCEAGKFSTMNSSVSSGACRACKVGTYGTISGSTTDSDCEACQAGKASVNITTCLPCLAGLYSARNGSNFCSSCPEGKFSAFGESFCTACQPGKYSNTPQASSAALCITCSSGGVSEEGSTTCKTCPAGTYAANDECLACASGFYSDVSGASDPSVCIRCPYGKMSFGNGEFSLDSRSSCYGCPAGTYFTNKCFTLYNQSGLLHSNWSEARRICLSNGCDLASINSQVENDVVKDIVMTSKIAGAGVWIGYFFNSLTNDDWRWSDGSSNEYTNWDALQPSVTSGQVSYAYMSSNTDGLWSAVTIGASNSKTLPFICACACTDQQISPVPCKGCARGKYSNVSIQLNKLGCQDCLAGTYTSVLGASFCVSCLAGTFSSIISSFQANVSYSWDSICDSSNCNSATRASICKLNCKHGCVGRRPPSGLYGNNEHIVWIIAPAGASTVALQFTYMDTEPDYDFVTIYSCQDPTCTSFQLIGSVSGNDDNSTYLPQYNLQYGIKLEWQSDSSIQRTGWEANWSSSFPPACDFCSAGKFSTNQGADDYGSCVDCPSGSYSSDDAASDCLICMDGEYMNSSDSTLCFSCEPGKYSIGTIKCLTFGLEPLDWFSAEDTCIRQNGHLVSIGSDAENLQIWNLYASDFDSSGGLWIGYHKAGRVWNWSDGSNQNYSIWEPPILTSSVASVVNKYATTNAPHTNPAVPSKSTSKSASTSSNQVAATTTSTTTSIATTKIQTSTARQTVKKGGTIDSTLSRTSSQTTSSTTSNPLITTTSAFERTSSSQMSTSAPSKNNQIETQCVRLLNGVWIIVDCNDPARFACYHPLELCYIKYADTTLSMHVMMGASSCIKCAAGTFSATSGARNCSLCEVGTYSTSLEASENQTCISCLPGTFSTAKGSDSSVSCLQCKQGKFASSAGVSSCDECEKGAYSNITGAKDQSECLMCESGKYGSAAAISSCSSCDSGKYSTAVGPNSSQTCESCSIGKFSANKAVGSEKYCQFCIKGTFSDVLAASACEQCGVGNYSETDGMSACLRCQPAKYSSALGSTSCFLCEAGSFSTTNGSSSCILCNPGSFSSQGKTFCTACDVGTYATSSGSTVCQLCKIGTYQTGQGMNSQGRCNSCESGLFSSAPGASFCAQCPRGTFSNTSEADICTDCGVGSYQTGFGMPSPSNCSLCGSGTFQSLSGRTSSLSCLECMAGKYATGLGAQSCTLCQAGKYQTGFGMIFESNCSQCVPNTYNPNIGSQSALDCRPCPNKTSTMGSAGNINVTSCVCDSLHYEVLTEDNLDFECQECPLGGLFVNVPGESDCGCAFNKHVACKAQPLVGNWTPTALGFYQLVACPPGYSLRSAVKTGSQKLQTCQKCLPGYYVLDPNTDDCQMCPPGGGPENLVVAGAECSGSYAVVSGSVWSLSGDGDVYILESCPAGYRIQMNFSMGRPVWSTQYCEPCPMGYECVSLHCSNCTPCPPGTYKDVVSTDACYPCDVNTFNQHSGSVSRGDCLSCPCLSTTLGKIGRSAQDDCVCGSQYYKVVNNETASCQTCPKGATCSSDQSCGLRRPPTFSCPNSSDILGLWIFDDETGFYELQSCPVGFSTVTTSKAGSVDLQECKACLSPEQYILRSFDDCQTCPPGLICDGHNNATPSVSGSSWVKNGSIFLLTACPAGYMIS